MVINTSEEAIEVPHAKCVEQSWNDLLCSKMTDFVAKTDIIDVLPCLVLKMLIFYDILMFSIRLFT